jgi:hypothetical protein
MDGCGETTPGATGAEQVGAAVAGPAPTTRTTIGETSVTVPTTLLPTRVFAHRRVRFRECGSGRFIEMTVTNPGRPVGRRGTRAGEAGRRALASV